MADLNVYKVTMPMARRFGHAAALRSRSESVVLTLAGEGIEASGECAPRRYVTNETIDTVIAEVAAIDLRAFRRALATNDPRAMLETLINEGARATFNIVGGNNTLCALELLALDYLGRRGGRSISSLCGSRRDADRAIPISQVIDSELSVEEFLARRGPFHFIKFKSGDNFQRDLAALRTIRAATPDTPVMVDANMGWDIDQAIANARQLLDLGIGMLEEPLAPRRYDDLRRLREATGIAVMLDESVCSLRDARAAQGHGACDAINLRLAKMGGWHACLSIARFARQHGIAYQVGVQVAEVATLVDAGRALSFCLADAVTTEGGQSDLFFAHPVARFASRIDRHTNTIAAPIGHGFGAGLTDALASYHHHRISMD